MSLAQDQKMREVFSAARLNLMLLAALLFFPSEIRAQIRTDAPYLLPQIIFVGDRGRLVVPLGPSFNEVAAFVLEAPDELPQIQDLLLRRIELERRGGHSRLLIDFIPYAPGTFTLPPLDFLFPDESNFRLPPLRLQVASILNTSNMALSEPASPLAVPGTSLLIYGTGFLLLVLLSLGILCGFLGPRYFRELWVNFLHRYRIRLMMGFLKRLRNECILGKNVVPGFCLTNLSAKMRDFLSYFTGYNCRSLTAMEFLELPLSGTALVPEQLCKLFRTWDTLRFSGQSMEITYIFEAIEDVSLIIVTLDRAEREKHSRKSTSLPEAAAGGVL